MPIKLPIKGTLTGCAKMQYAWQKLSQEEKDRFRESIKTYPHMTPCPQENMYWVIKEDSCRYCPLVLVDNQKRIS